VVRLLDLPFRTIPQGQDELQENKGQVNVLEHGVDDCVDRGRERPWFSMWFVGGSNQVHDNASREPKRG